MLFARQDLLERVTGQVHGDERVIDHTGPTGAEGGRLQHRRIALDLGEE